MSTPIDDIRSEVWREIDETAEQRRRAECFDSLVAACDDLYTFAGCAWVNEKGIGMEEWKRRTAMLDRARAILAKARQENQA